MDSYFSWDCLTQTFNSTIVMQLKSLIPAIPGFFAIACAAIAALQPTALAVLPRISSNEYINYTTLMGFFLQDDPATNPSTFDYVSPLASGRTITNFHRSPQ
jgi:hypothetical protein